MNIAAMPGRTVSAPGSLMLLGEHAVLHGRRALVCAINRRINVKLVPLALKELRILSSLGEYECPLDNLVDHPSLRYVIQAVRQHARRVPSGFSLHIESGFSADIGFGSSAAVTAAVHAAILFWLLGEPPGNAALFKEALKTIHAVQGRGSGADLAASVFGGLVGYTTDPTFDPLALSVPLTAVYCGYKVPTPEVIRRLDALRLQDPSKYEHIFNEMDRSVGQAVECLRQHDWPGFGRILNRNQELMDEMGVNTPELQEIVESLQAAPDVFGAKISGSGMGDCAVGIGYADLKNAEYPVYHLEISPMGVAYHA